MVILAQAQSQGSGALTFQILKIPHSFSFNGNAYKRSLETFFSKMPGNKFRGFMGVLP
jgi:hypothetical protein